MQLDAGRAWTVADLRKAIEGAEDHEVVVFRRTKAKTNICWCGCGGLTGGKFVPGHDARFHGLAKRVARGEAEMPSEFVSPEAERDFMKWHNRELAALEADAEFAG